MGSNFLSPSGGKRVLHYASTMSDSNPYASNGSAKRAKQQHSPMAVPTGHVVFRMLSHMSRIGGVIGKSGSVIKQLQQSTGAKIRIEVAPDDAPDRVITVIASSAITSKVRLGSDDKSGEVDVSKAQEALVRVFERILEVAAVSGSVGLGEGVVSCRLLADSRQAGSVIGKGGKVVEKIRKESGCRIKVLMEKLPACAEPGDEMVELEGDVLAVKKALVAVSRCIQDCQPIDKSKIAGGKPLDTVSQERLHRPVVVLPQEKLHRPVELIPQDALHRHVHMFSSDILHRPGEVVSRDALRRPVEVTHRDALSRSFNLLGHDALRRPFEVVSQDSLRRPFEIDSQDYLRRPFEMGSQDYLRRPFEMGSQDSLRRPFEMGSQDSLRRPFERGSQDSLRRPFEMGSQDSLRRPFEMGSQDSLRRPFEMGSQDSLRRPFEMGSQDSLRRPFEMGSQDSLRRPSDTVSRGTLPELHVSQRNSVLHSMPSSSVSYASGVLPSSSNTERLSIIDPETPQQEVVFKILCHIDRVGGVIGKGGAFIRGMQSETGTSISIGPTVPDCDERVVTITSLETPELRYSPAQKAIILVLSLSLESANGVDSVSSKISSIAARLLVPSIQVGCLIGKGGTTISEMRNITGASIRILGGDQLPKCVSAEDQLVQITGELSKVKDAIYQVTGRLRDNIFSTPPKNMGTKSSYSDKNDTNHYGRLMDHISTGLHSSVGLSHSLNRHSTLAHSMDQLGVSHSLDRPPSPRPWASQAVTGVNSRGTVEVDRGLPSFKAGLEMGSGNRSAIVTNTTVEIRVPESVFGSVYGENGSNLNRLRKISHAKVIVHEPRLGTSDRIIVISGTPDETQAAQSLLQAYILTG